MKKNGFVFVESIVVLVVVALSLAMMISSYSLVTRKTKEKEYYNKASDKYLLYSLSSIATDEKCNYGISCNGEDISFRADAQGETYNCKSTKIGGILEQCDQVFTDLGLVRIYVIENIVSVLKDTNSLSLYDSGTLEFIKTLKKCNDENTSTEYDPNTFNASCENPIVYMVGVFDRGNSEYSYAAIEVGFSNSSGMYRCPISSDCTTIYSDWTKERNQHGITSQCIAKNEANADVCGSNRVRCAGSEVGRDDIYEWHDHDYCHCGEGTCRTTNLSDCEPGTATCYKCTCYKQIPKTCTFYDCPTKSTCEYTYGDFQSTKYGPEQDQCIKE